MGSEQSAFVGMVLGYWENACALLNYGLLHEGLFFETSGEFFMVYDQIKKVLPEFRNQMGDKYMMSNLEKAAKRFETWSNKRSPGGIEKMRQMMKPQNTKAKSAKG